MKHLSTTILLLYFSIFASYAQIEYGGKPIGAAFDNIGKVPFISLESATRLEQTFWEKRDHEEDINYKSDKFGETIDLEINTVENGRWLKPGENFYVWQIGITSQNASSLGVLFSPFFLKPGVKLFVYAPDVSEVRGAFTFRNNKTSGVFAVSPIKGDSLIIELQVFGDSTMIDELVIQSIGIGFPSELNEVSEKDGYYGWAAECEVDINCNFNKDIQQQKYSTCRVLYNNTNRCTGTLINNTLQDGTPYILTGGHCIKNQSDAESAIFAFDYESPYCEGPDGKMKSISGSTLLSRSSNLDFALVQLSETPPADYYPVYAGWDASGAAANYTYVPHHPEGDVKKITINSDSLWTNSFTGYDPFTHWLIPRYESGTTEDGSSGGALFDTTNRVIGTLTGGGTACSEYIYDYYQKISHCWNDYPAGDEQLKNWLDPLNSGILKMDTYMPVDPWLAYSEELSNIAPGEGIESPYCSASEGWITGHNSDRASNYVEHFYVHGSKYIYAVQMDIARAYFTYAPAKFNLKIWEGNTEAEEVVYEKDVYLFELDQDTLNYIPLDTMILVNGNFYVGYEIYYTAPSDTFAVKMVYNASPREINTAYKSISQLGYSSSFDAVWEPLSCDGQSINTSLAIYPVVFNYYISQDTDPENFPVNEVTLYPNPAYDYVQILFKTQPEGTVTVKVIDLSGRVIGIWTDNSPEPNIRLNTSSLIRGMYVVRIEYSEGTFSGKLLIL